MTQTRTYSPEIVQSDAGNRVSKRVLHCRMGTCPAPTLEKYGDPMEQKWWATVQPHFPLYEGFWQAHIFTLRDANGHIRADIHDGLE